MIMYFKKFENMINKISLIFVNNALLTLFD